MEIGIGRARSTYRRRVPNRQRVIVPGHTYHVYSRGSNRLPIFFQDEDCRMFLKLLEKIVSRDRWQLLAYCLMPNHFHLLVEAGEDGLSNGMRELNGGYSRRISLWYGRTAHLFKNRFGCVESKSDGQLIWTARYIILNPVRAGFCADPRQWPWSSYRATAGFSPAPPWLAVDRLLEYFATGGADAREEYRRFVADALPTASDAVTETHHPAPNRPKWTPWQAEPRTQ